jgi:hypothetical protein
MMEEELMEKRKFSVICPFRNATCGKSACGLWDYEYGECAILEIGRFMRKIAENLKKRGEEGII